MSRRFVFVDEARNFDFSRSRGASRYFILVSVTLDNCAIGDDLVDLRRELAWEGVELKGQFRATEETQAVRDRVFRALAARTFRIDATIIDKPKTRPELRPTKARFYKTAWYLHMQHLLPRVAEPDDELLVVGASVGTHREHSIFSEAMSDAMREAAPQRVLRTAFWSASSEPCLQVADNCCWAVQRKWERGDERSHVLIAKNLHSEYDVLGTSTETFY